MERPNDETPTSDMLERSARTCAAVAADPEVRGHELGLREKHVALKTCVRNMEDKNEEVLGKDAIFFVADTECDNVVRAYELALLGAVGKNREHPYYARYFKDGVRSVTEADARKAEPALVKKMLAAMAEDVATPLVGPLVALFSPQLQAALDRVETTESDLAGVEAEMSFLTTMTLPKARSEWAAEYVKLHGNLRAALPFDLARVESFFLPFRKPRKKAAAAAAGAKTGAGAAAPAGGPSAAAGGAAGGSVAAPAGSGTPPAAGSGQGP